MLMSGLAPKYAHALYLLARERKLLSRTAEQLRMVKQVLAENDDLASFMYYPHVPGKAKKEVIEQLFAGELADFVYKFLLLLIDKRREAALPAIVDEYVALANAEQGVIEAAVTVAAPLDAAAEAALAAKLAAVTGKKVRLRTKIDGRIVGGVIVKIGDKMIDGSVMRRLKTLKEKLLQVDALKIGVTNGS